MLRRRPGSRVLRDAEHPVLGDDEVDGDVVGLVGHLGEELVGVDQGDEQRAARERREGAVVVAGAAPQAAAAVIRGERRDDHHVDVGEGGRAETLPHGLVDAEP
jgi:hypothetical protein